MTQPEPLREPPHADNLFPSLTFATVTMLKSPSARPPSTSLPAGQGWFSSSKTGKHVTPTQAVVTVVTRVIHKPKEKLASVPASTSSSSPTSIGVVKKRKKRETDDSPYGGGAKKPRATSTRPKKRASVQPERFHQKLSVPPPEMVFRNSRSRSVSAFDHAEAPVARKCWTDHDGTVGDDFISCEKVVKRLMHSYKAFFRNPLDAGDKSFEPHPTDYPFVDLEYPNDNASERFMLLEPRDKDHYNPIMCLEQTLHTIVEFYLTESQQALFGTLPNRSLASPARSPPNSSTSNTSSSSLSSLTESDQSDSSSLSSLSSISTSSCTSSDLLRSLSRAIHLRDGPLFLSTMARINALLRELKYPSHPVPSLSANNPLRDKPKSWSTEGIPKKVMMRIIDETYQRSVGPHVSKLRRYSAFSSEVYGELMPAFTSDIVTATRLRPDSLFVDLGSGVGNVVLQASLQTGCRGFGVEVMPGPADLADGQLKQFKMRCRMWGVEAGDVELMQGDMTNNTRVDELMAKADVVLVNNFVFREELNAALRPKFLDLKEGAIVVSLKPFAPPSNQRLTERNIDDISAIFDVIPRPYHSGTVSWSSGSGQYYIHRVDREGYNDCRQQFERVQSALGRGKRARRG